MKRLLLLPFTALFVFTFFLQSCSVTEQAVPPAGWVRPAWAPADLGDARYYYFPDLEVYYDSWQGEYVYLDDGSWIFSAELPPAYAGYDLNTAYIVGLDRRAYSPWLHNDLYLSHYPRYYHRTYYDAHNTPGGEHPRGFSENKRTPVYSGTHNTPNINPPRPNASAPAQVHNEPHNNNVAHNENVTHNEPHNTTQTSPAIHRTQPASYSGRNIGQPVHITRSMSAPRGGGGAAAAHPSGGAGAPHGGGKR